jgi:hypothetical protein
MLAEQLLTVGSAPRPMPPRSGATASAAGAALAPKKESSTPRPQIACERWPEGYWLHNGHGLYVKGKCGSANKCDPCSRAAAALNAEMLKLDALNGVAPNMWMVLSTRSTNPEQKAYYRSREKVVKALKRRWPEVEYWSGLEMTTGYGTNSGGHRRPHWNVPLKGIPDDALDEVRALVVGSKQKPGIWCQREDALPKGQSVDPIYSAPGLMGYLALHFQKESQTPPNGWKGQRNTHSKGYLWLPVKEAREVAKLSIQHRQDIWRGVENGLDALDAEAFAEAQMRERAETSWALIYGRTDEEKREIRLDRWRRSVLATWEGPPVCAAPGVADALPF